jgi:hypothetical protein
MKLRVSLKLVEKLVWVPVISFCKKIHSQLHIWCPIMSKLAVLAPNHLTLQITLLLCKLHILSGSWLETVWYWSRSTSVLLHPSYFLLPAALSQLPISPSCHCTWQMNIRLVGFWDCKALSPIRCLTLSSCWSLHNMLNFESRFGF